MATRAEVVSLVQQTLERPFLSIIDISKNTIMCYSKSDVPYSHIWTSYIANKGGLTNSQAPLTASCDKGANWFRRRKRYKLGQSYGGSYVPCPGDYIYFSSTYKQADATDVAIVLSSDGTLVTVAYWDCEEGYPKEGTWYLHDMRIIGYGIPEYEDVVKIEMPELATKGNAVAIIGEETYVHTGPGIETPRTGTLSKGYAVEVLGTTLTGWLKVVWGLSKNGYAYIDNGKLLHKIIKDEIPYTKFEGFKIGDKVQFKGGKLYSNKTQGSKCKTSHKPFVAKVTGVSSGRYHIEEQIGTKRRKGWADKKDVDFVPVFGYDKYKGEVSVNKACLRIGPGREFTKVQKWPQMVKGNIVDVLGTDTDDDNNKWLLIVIGGVKGYVEDYCIEYIEA